MVSIRCRPVLAVVADWLRLGLRLRRRGRKLAAPILFCLPLHCRCLRVLELEPIRRAARPVARAEPFGHDPPPSPSCRRGGTPPRLPGVQGAHLAAPRCGSCAGCWPVSPCGPRSALGACRCRRAPVRRTRTRTPAAIPAAPDPIIGFPAEPIALAASHSTCLPRPVSPAHNVYTAARSPWCFGIVRPSVHLVVSHNHWPVASADDRRHR
jgi:hypothetical protein